MAIILDGTTGITTPDLIDSSLTSGRVVYAGGSGNLTGSSGLTFDGTNFGVGEASPSSFGKTTVAGSSGAGGVNVWVRNTSDASADNVKYAGIQFSVGSDNGSSAIRSYRTNSATNYESALAFLTNPTGATQVPVERARFNSTGAFVFAGGTATANGIGITFPATQSASSNANTLDDYEEGTWTTTTASTTNISGITLQQAKYTKVGRMVTIDGYFDATIASANSLTYFSFTIPFPLISTTAGGCGAVVTNMEFAPGSVYRASGSTSVVYIVFKASVGFGSGANALFFTYTYQTT